MILFFSLLFRLPEVNEETHTNQGNHQGDDTGDDKYREGDFSRRWTHYAVRRIYECITPMIGEFSFVNSLFFERGSNMASRMLFE